MIGGRLACSSQHRDDLGVGMGNELNLSTLLVTHGYVRDKVRPTLIGPIEGRLCRLHDGSLKPFLLCRKVLDPSSDLHVLCYC